MKRASSCFGEFTSLETSYISNIPSSYGRIILVKRFWSSFEDSSHRSCSSGFNITGSSVTSLSTTATTGPTNTAQPALAVAFAGGTSNLAQWVSATNSYIPDFTTGGISGGGNYMHSVVKELTALAANDTTITWTTPRASVYTGLAVFKNVSTANHNALLLMGVG